MNDTLIPLLATANHPDQTETLRAVPGEECENFDTRELDTALVCYALGWNMTGLQLHRHDDGRRVFGHFFFDRPTRIPEKVFTGHIRNKTLVLNIEITAVNQARHYLKGLVQEERSRQDGAAKRG